MMSSTRAEASTCTPATTGHRTVAEYDPATQQPVAGVPPADAWRGRSTGHSTGRRPNRHHHRQALAHALGMRPLQAHCYRGLGTLYATIGQQAQARAELSVVFL